MRIFVLNVIFDVGGLAFHSNFDPKYEQIIYKTNKLYIPINLFRYVLRLLR